MSKNREQWNIEQWFDGEAPEAAGLADPEGDFSEARSYLEMLEKMRDGVQAVATHEAIGDAQFPAFMDGIREQLEQPKRAPARKRWALASLTAAALIAAVSVYLVLGGGDGNGATTPVEAAVTEVESARTDIEGATVHTYYSSESGVATVWVEPGEGEIW